MSGYEQSGLFSAAEKAALKWAEQMTRTPVDVPDGVFAELKRHFSDAEIVELTATVALENMRARFNRPLLIDSDGFCPLPQNHPVRAAAGR